MNIQQEDNGRKGRFFVQENETILAEMSYVWSGDDKFIIDHTEVDDSLSGKGVGKQLVMKAVEMAREKRIKILPLCPFAKAVFDKVEIIQDVLF
ncbi:MAG: GNAT family N-acetyltransferase [Chitinophagaceae bacterium]